MIRLHEYLGKLVFVFFQVPQHSKPRYYSTGDNGFRMSVQRNIRRNTKQKHWPVGIQQVTPDWQHGRSRRESSGQLLKRIFTLLNTGLVYDTNHRLISLSLQVVTVSPCGGAQTGHCARVSSVKDLLSTSSPLTSWGLFTLWITLTLQCMNTHTHDETAELTSVVVWLPKLLPPVVSCVLLDGVVSTQRPSSSFYVS